MIEEQYSDGHIMQSLSSDRQALIKKIEKKIKDQPDKISELGRFVQESMRQENVADFDTISEDARLSVILEYVAIGLISEVFVETDFKKFE